MLTQKDFHGYQDILVDHLVDNSRCAGWVFMGGGKTAATLTALEILSLTEDIYPAIIIAPLRVAKTTWPKEPVKWEHLKHLKVVPIVGELTNRMLALKTPSKIYSINFEQIPWLIDLYGKNWPFKTIVVDEATTLRGFRKKQGALRAQKLYQVSWLPQVKHFKELTGTPSPLGIQDLWGQSMFLDQGDRLGRTYDSFKHRWFMKDWDNEYGIVPLPHAQKEIEGLMSDLCMSVRTEDWFDLKEPIITKIYIDLPPEAQKLYNQMEKEMFITIEEEGILAVNAGAKRNKCVQIAQGAAYYQTEEDKLKARPGTAWKEIHDEKIQALRSIVEEAAGAPILVAYHYNFDLERLLRAFPKGRHLDAKSKTIDEWNAGKIPILFAHPAAAGHGLNLQDPCNILVYYGHGDNLEHHQQILERIGPMRQLQSGHNRNVLVYHIIARGTVEDYAILPSLQGKASLQSLLMEAMSRRKSAP